MGESPKPWEPQPGETAKAYKAFSIYRDMGPKRTIKQAYRDYTGRQDHTGDVAKYFQAWNIGTGWPERAAAYDLHMEKLAMSAEERALQERATVWAERLDQQREQEWLLAEALREKAEEMLSYPLVKTIEKNGGTTVIVMPADWRPADAVAFLKAASQIGRLAIGNPDQSVDEESHKEKRQVMMIGGKVIEF